MTERRQSLAPYEDPLAFIDTAYSNEPVELHPFENDPDVVKQIHKDERVVASEQSISAYRATEVGAQALAAVQPEMKRDRAKLRAPL